MSATNKKSILCLVQLPPPVHGASMMNNYVVKSKIINDRFDLEVIDLHFIDSLDNIGRFSIRKVLLSIKYFNKIFLKILKNRPDLVYYTLSASGYAFYRDALFSLLLKMFRLKILFHLHGKGVKNSVKGNTIKKILYSFVFSNTNVICLSRLLVNDINIVYKPEPYIVPNGIPFYPYNEHLKKWNDIPKILFLSNYKVSKGVLVLLEALKILKLSNHKFVASLVGADSDMTKSEIKNIVNNLDLATHVEVKGPLYGKMKYQEFFNSDIFVFPTYYNKEAFPIVIIEAMQNKLPIISTYEGGIPDLMKDSESGYIVEIKNSEMLAEKLSILIRNKGLRIRMGQKGYKLYKENFTLSHFEKRMLRTFNKVLCKK